ncbi:hypothetical protein BD769DRAFT_635695 [Suillus cothurnatus]|nr:hypothetical protein BD769DRAFT_635695 [Suillus cothurnatus]
MSLHFRTAKSASNWEQDDLELYHITIEPLNPAQFFPSVPNTLGGLDPALAFASFGATYVSDKTYRVLRFLEAATDAKAHETSTDEFAHVILTAIGFDDEHELDVRVRYPNSLWVCGEKRSAEVHVCLRDWSAGIVYIIQENKTTKNSHDPEPQLIAEAIAAFQNNNNIRQGMGLDSLDKITLPCITMVGTRVTFYLVPVTDELNNAVVYGTYPESETKVRKCQCKVDGVDGGMEDPVYRTRALQQYIAFRDLAKSY